MIFIYALIDPTDKKVRYIGMTQTINTRLKKHIADAKKKSCSRLHWGLNCLSDQGITPEVEILEICQDKYKSQREKFYIHKYKRLNYGLVNSTNGGIGGATNTGRKFIEIKRPRAKGAKRSEEVKKRMSDAQKGRKLSEERKQQISAAAKKSHQDNPRSGWKLNAATKNKMSRSQTVAWSRRKQNDTL